MSYINYIFSSIVLLSLSFSFIVLIQFSIFLVVYRKLKWVSATEGEACVLQIQKCWEIEYVQIKLIVNDQERIWTSGSICSLRGYISTTWRKCMSCQSDAAQDLMSTWYQHIRVIIPSCLPWLECFSVQCVTKPPDLYVPFHF